MNLKAVIIKAAASYNGAQDEYPGWIVPGTEDLVRRGLSV